MMCQCGVDASLDPKSLLPLDPLAPLAPLDPKSFAPWAPKHWTTTHERLALSYDRATRTASDSEEIRAPTHILFKHKREKKRSTTWASRTRDPVFFLQKTFLWFFFSVFLENRYPLGHISVLFE
jgi:hypothetical protein